MKQIAFVARLLAMQRHQPFFSACFLLGVSFAPLQSSHAQTVQPQPTAASTPVVTPTAAPSPTPAATPSPTPTATPYPGPTSTPAATPTESPTPVPTTTPIGGGSPSITIVPGLPSVTDMDAYNAARTPLINITLTAPTTGSGTSGTSAASSRATSSIQPVVKGGACPLITLQPAAASQSKTSRTSAADAVATSQPVATITLTYNGNAAGQRVWVQPLRGGTLTATDSTGKVYDGSRGFFLTVSAGGTATFSYQAPNISGTYQVLTRFSNVITALPFAVPDPAP